jgi:hypothetical protein
MPLAVAVAGVSPVGLAAAVDLASPRLACGGRGGRASPERAARRRARARRTDERQRSPLRRRADPLPSPHSPP